MVNRKRNQNDANGQYAHCIDNLRVREEEEEELKFLLILVNLLSVEYFGFPTMNFD